MTAVAIIGTLDTKGSEFAFLNDRIRGHGRASIVIDIGVLGQPAFEAGVAREEVAARAGSSIDALRAAGDRGAAMAAMARGARFVLSELFSQGTIDSAIGMGGSGNATVASYAMQGLPIGVPKLLLTTLASGDTRPYVGASDLTIMPSIVDIAGLNRLSCRMLANAAAAVCGMAQMPALAEPPSDRPLIAATMFGVTTPCVTAARKRLEDLGYEVLVFHATGTGGQAMETLARDGFLSGVLDITTTEIADELCGGVLSAGPERLEAAGAAGLPQVVSLGALDMVNFGPLDTVPAQFSRRRLHAHNAAVTLMRTTLEENRRIGETLARKINAARGPISVFVPLGGVSSIDVEGMPFQDQDADAALVAALKQHLRPEVRLVEMNVAINDPVFALAMAEEFDRMHRQWRMAQAPKERRTPDGSALPAPAIVDRNVSGASR